MSLSSFSFKLYITDTQYAHSFYSDTKLLAKSLVCSITAAAQKLYSSPQGRRSLLYLLLPRSRRHFTPAQIAFLAETDEIRSRTSKKSSESREDEVRRAASEDLIQWVEQSGESLIREPAGCLIVTDIMLYGEGGTLPHSHYTSVLD